MTSFGTFLKQHRAESICFALFILLACLGFAVHEMWYDEAQAWQIARTAPLQDILFLIPHYEGHPPFWHLLLALPAKLGVPWQWGVNSIGLLFMLASGFLIFFKAPFARWVRCLLPFNYFLFYQYGIIVRPYSALVLIMLLLAVYFPQRNQRPALFIGLLAALCACHIFGIALAGGITLAWLWDIKNEYGWKKYIPSFLKNKRFYYMLGLLAWALMLLALIRQTDGVLDAYLAYTASVLKQGLYVLFALPADTVLTDLASQLYVMTADLPYSGLLTTCVIGLVLWGVLLAFLPRKYLLYLVLPYLLVGAIMLHYLSRHHIGVLLVLVIWYAWITLRELPLLKRPDALRQLAGAVLALALTVPLLWSVYAVYLDYKLVYFPGKQVAEFLDKYHLKDKRIFSSWELQLSNDNSFWGDPHFMPTAVMLNVYLPQNIIANFNDASPRAYNLNVLSTEQEKQRVAQQWRERGLPDVLLGPAALPMVYDDPTVIKQYRVAWAGMTYIPWKFNRPKQDHYDVYLREAVWDELKAQIMGSTPNRK